MTERRVSFRKYTPPPTVPGPVGALPVSVEERKRILLAYYGVPDSRYARAEEMQDAMFLNDEAVELMLRSRHSTLSMDVAYCRDPLCLLAIFLATLAHLNRDGSEGRQWAIGAMRNAQGFAQIPGLSDATLSFFGENAKAATRP